LTDIVLIANFDNVGINGKEVFQFTIYPNPAIDVLKLIRSTTDNAKIEIYTSDGALIKTQSLETNETTAEIDVSSFPTGVYLIRLIEGQNDAVQRFVVSF